MKFGEFELFAISDGRFKLDGGAMFGVIPKVLWSKLIPSNDLNRISLGLNCLLIKSDSDLILVDTGIGTLYDEKFASMFEIDKSSSLIAGLAALDLKPDDITKVILTHLHFDHCGGNCTRGEDGQIRPTFQTAQYFVQKGELEYAKQPDPRSKGSYLSHNWEALESSGQIELLSGNQGVVPGIEVFVTGGHTRDHQIIKISSNGKVACFLADLVPTDSHLKTVYVMGYDLYPKMTMEIKEKVLRQALQENWLLVFQHASTVKAGYLQEVAGKMQIQEVQMH